MILKTPRKSFGDFFMLVETQFPDCTVIRETASDNMSSTWAFQLAEEICDGTIEEPIVKVLGIFPKNGRVRDMTEEIAGAVEKALWKIYETHSAETYVPQNAVDLVNRFRPGCILADIRKSQKRDARDYADYASDKRLLASELI